MFWIVKTFAYLFGLSLFFFPAFWVKIALRKYLPFSGKQEEISKIATRFLGGIISGTFSFLLTITYGVELLNVDRFKDLPQNIRLFSAPLSGIIVVAGLLAYATSENLMNLIKNLTKFITKSEEKAKEVHRISTKIFRTYCVFIVLVAPFFGISTLVEFYRP
ncbi:hypothetical protein KAW18_12225 [candidate division WOR-3 bacterium]|nr:hypothetical protein [candidate division WOR-3 bacterium]